MRNKKLKPWLDEGVKRVAVKGLSSLNVSDMADDLEISKSSFYHYFNTKEEYLDQLIEYWEEEGTDKIIKQVLLHDELDEPVLFLVSHALEVNIENEFVLQQFRAAMGVNPLIRKKVLEVDQIRISFLTAMLSKLGYSKDEVKVKAHQIYRFFLGSIAHCQLVKPSKKKKQQILDDFRALFGGI